MSIVRDLWEVLVNWVLSDLPFQKVSDSLLVLQMIYSYIAKIDKIFIKLDKMTIIWRCLLRF